jgi:peptidoglycan hydrolase-like protein with peptidoglycan-binding domain
MTIKDTLKLSLITTAVMSSANAQAIGGDDLPPARPGQCFTKAFFPAKYATTTERVLASEASEKVQVIPAKYGWGTEKVKISDGTQRVVTVPATYKTVYERVLSAPASQTWRTGLNSNATEASNTCVQSAASAGMNVSGATPGTCFFEHYRPAKYQTTTEKVLASEASERVQAIPAKYRTVSKRILVSEGTERLVTTPAQYKTVSERVQISPARTEWKRTKCGDRGCNQSEVVCLVEIPPVYNTVTKKVVAVPPATRKVTTPPQYKTVQVQELVEPATSRTIPIPATYKTVTKRAKVQEAAYSWTDASGANARTRSTAQCNKICLTATPAKYNKVSKRVVARPASTKTLTTPAKYTTVKIKKLISPASERRIAIPATYKTITKRNMIADGYAKWVPIVCKSNMTNVTISRVQSALKSAGYYNGAIDGIWGQSSKSATRAYQKAKGLPVAGLSVATMESLGLY